MTIGEARLRTSGLTFAAACRVAVTMVGLGALAHPASARPAATAVAHTRRRGARTPSATSQRRWRVKCSSTSGLEGMPFLRERWQEYPAPVRRSHDLGNTRTRCARARYQRHLLRTPRAATVVPWTR